MAKLHLKEEEEEEVKAQMAALSEKHSVRATLHPVLPG